ncbi:MAG: DUF3298 and DUF4163 domain-containing protein [Clostridiales bacterium]|nr:DUF3298 and DUF4163 domain-containing protein [Clostridiales bacterium]
MDDFDTPIIEEKSIQDEMLYNDIKVLRYSIFYPILTGKEETLRINAFYLSRIKRMERFIRTRLYKETVSRYKKSVNRQIPFFETQVTSDFCTSSITDTFFSVYEDSYEYLGGANGQNERTAQTWFIKREKKLRLSDFFRRGTHWRNTIFNFISDTIRKQLEDGEDTYFDNWELLIRRYFNQNNYYLTEEGFAVFYQETTIAPHSSGVIVFTVPYDIFTGGLLFDLLTSS